ncbi:hypothetical protein [Microcoleus sp. herbarium12]|uniref:hypothetical protein n=1 Tax=Microcoleus sp. herbarium12 TaxID=3055437 RepID=UPI002FD739AF
MLRLIERLGLGYASSKCWLTSRDRTIFKFGIGRSKNLRIEGLKILDRQGRREGKFGIKRRSLGESAPLAGS